MSLLLLLLLVFSIVVSIQAAYTLYLMLYTWDQPDVFQQARAPEEFLPPQLSFTVLLPARHEEEVIQQTIARVAAAHYPRELLEAVVICEASDTGTIARAQEKVQELQAQGYAGFRLVVFNDRPINKPHGLNVGFRTTQHQVVTIFDAEDEIHPDIFAIVNTVMLREGVQVVQCGVQLMNYTSSWYSILNVLEYFFWFKSRLHFQARLGSITLGGNTVFFAREVLETLGGWDETNLTEDADVGIRISALGIPVRVVYDDRYVTKEETPPTLGHFVRQRTRWCQGFLQTVRKGNWAQLPSWKQRALALYTLAFPSVQALLALYVPVSVWMFFAVTLPVPVAMVLIFPLYFLGAHFLVSAIGLYEFAGAHRLRPSWTTLVVMALTYLPYQWLLGYSALRAVVRELRGLNNWEKTAHVGAHRPAERQGTSTPATPVEERSA